MYVLYRNRNYKINKKSAGHGTNIIIINNRVEACYGANKFKYEENKDE